MFIEIYLGVSYTVLICSRTIRDDGLAVLGGVFCRSTTAVANVVDCTAVGTGGCYESNIYNILMLPTKLLFLWLM